MGWEPGTTDRTKRASFAVRQLATNRRRPLVANSLALLDQKRQPAESTFELGVVTSLAFASFSRIRSEAPLLLLPLLFHRLRE